MSSFSRILGAISLSLWLGCLALPGLVLYAPWRHMRGIEILTMGWLSPLIGNFAWFANVFFLYGVFVLLIGTSAPIKSSLIAAVLSLHTFAMATYLLDEGGGNTPVWGYGWGAMLWFLAIFVLVTGAGFRASRTTQDQRGEKPGAVGWIGLILCGLAFGLSGFFAIHDRMVANPSELSRLSGIAFKRTAVCRAPDPYVQEPIHTLKGPVEIVLSKGALNATYPFGQVKSLLAWGIPVIRVAGVDYVLSGAEGNVSSRPSEGPAAATLLIEEDEHQITAKLIETASDRAVFDQSWVRDVYWCPEYASFPKPSEQPRLLLSKALNLAVETASSKVAIAGKQGADNRVNGGVVRRREDGETRAMKAARWAQAHPGSNLPVPFHEVFNRNCPQDVGWDGQGYESRLNTGWPFRIGKESFFVGSRDRYNASCANKAVYLYFGGTSSNNSYYLRIEKRTVPEFFKVWDGIVLIPAAGVARDDVLKLESIQEDQDSMTMELVNEDSGQILVVQAPTLRQK
jgi:hypothetical protein